MVNKCRKLICIVLLMICKGLLNTEHMHHAIRLRLHRGAPKVACAVLAGCKVYCDTQVTQDTPGACSYKVLIVADIISS